MSFREVDLKSLEFSPFEKIGDEWALVTAGTTSGYNTMTVSWGGMGVLWGKDVVTIYVRPQRYTKEFLDANDRFTLSFYAPEHKEALRYLGTHSGRDSYKATHVASRRPTWTVPWRSSRPASSSCAASSTRTTSVPRSSSTPRLTAEAIPSTTITRCTSPRWSTRSWPSSI